MKQKEFRKWLIQQPVALEFYFLKESITHCSKLE